MSVTGDVTGATGRLFTVARFWRGLLEAAIVWCGGAPTVKDSTQAMTRIMSVDLWQCVVDIGFSTKRLVRFEVRFTAVRLGQAVVWVWLVSIAMLVLRD